MLLIIAKVETCLNKMGPIRLLIITCFWVVLAERTGSNNRTHISNNNKTHDSIKYDIFLDHRFNYGNNSLTINTNNEEEKESRKIGIERIQERRESSEVKYPHLYPLNDPRIFLLSENHHEHEKLRNSEVHSINITNINNSNSDTFPLLHRKHNYGVRNLTNDTTSVNKNMKGLKENIFIFRNNTVKQRLRNKARFIKENSKSHNVSRNSTFPIQIKNYLKNDVSNITTRKTESVTTPVKSNSAANSDEEYYAYAEYPDTSYNSSGYEEAGVLPEPESSLQEDEVTVALPDDSLVDTDLHDHDLIDSVMYIYFGASERDQGNPGRQVAAVGGVIALAAQLLTLASVARRLKLRPHDASAIILLNAELALTLANLLFMVGIQATGDRGTCQRIAVSLHYLHLAACCWFFTNSLHIYLSLRSACYRPKVILYCVLAWLLPIPIIMGSIGGRGYETRFYCWMSVERGMFLSFMLPVSNLILANTLTAVLGLRLAGEQDNARRALRVTVTVLPCFAVLWFLGVLALENSNSLLLPVLFITTNAFLNWFIFGWWLRGETGDEDDEEEEEEDLYEEMCRGLLKAHAQDDAWRRDAELQMDPICTISS